MDKFQDDLQTPLPTPEQPVVQVEASAEAVQVDNAPQPAPRPHRFPGVHSRGTVRKDNTNCGSYVDGFGRVSTTPPPAPAPREKFINAQPNVKYERNPNNQGSDESGRAMEVRGTKVVYKTTGAEVKSGEVESLSSFSTLVPKMCSRRL